MKILLTGGRGMLGRTLSSVLGAEHEVLATDLPEADITDANGIAGLFARCRPDAVIHCAAMTKVDLCETDGRTAFLLNGLGSGNVAAACGRLGIRLIAISTDYVFDGDGDRPWRESDRATGGYTVYGRSKFAGEQLIRGLCPDSLICRIAWLYGTGGPSFVHTMLKLADGSRPELKVVTDQIGNPTSCHAVAGGLRVLLAHPELSGICHLSCEGVASWYDFACEIFRLSGLRQLVTPCVTADVPRPARRPVNSALEKCFLREHGLPPMPDWKRSLADFLHNGRIW